jgi:transcriptional regulator with XRE-family HTH domain
MTKSYFGDNLYTLRKQRGLSQDEFAEKMGVSRQAISKWERNESYPDTENLIAIAKFFGVSIDDMINTSLDAQNIKSESEAQPAVAVVDVDDDDDKDDDDDRKNGNTVTFNLANSIPYPIVITVIYLLWGSITGWGWSVGWTLYVTIPVSYSILVCIKSRKLTPFNYPVFVTFVFLLFGMLYGIWHPLWVIYLTIPMFYPIAAAIDGHKKK